MKKNAKANSSKTELLMYQCQPNIPVIPTNTFLFKADNLIRHYYYKFLDIKASWMKLPSKWDISTRVALRLY